MGRTDLSVVLLAALAGVGCSGGHPPPARPVGTPSDAVAPNPLPAGCDSPPYHRLDFWLGTWDVTDAQGRYDGTNVVERGASGCTVEEHWVDASGWRGDSLFYFDRTARIWKQVWAAKGGETKEKREVVVPLVEGARFQGEFSAADGRVVRSQTTLAPQAGGRVLQRVDESVDGGKSWRSWEGLYQRLPDACATKEHRRFDFWLGDWKVHIKSRTAPDSEEWVEARGSNRVVSILNGCALEEQFTGEGAPSSWSGRSLSVWQPKQNRWRQTWTDDSGNYLAFTGNFAAGEMTLVGEPSPDGRTMRMVFTNISTTHLLWRWEGSKDGKSWRPMMTIEYEKELDR